MGRLVTVLEPAHSFDDSAAYERFMGPWSRATGSVFLDWMAPPPGALWADIGCGTGVFTELVLEMCSPAGIAAVDTAKAQIAYASRQPARRGAGFQVADAMALPFPDRQFDVVASALVLNFMPDRLKALAEMRRVARADAIVAGYVWDFAVELSPSWPLRRALRRCGADVPQVPGTAGSSLNSLLSLFEQAGFREIATRPIDVAVRFPDFDDFWRAQTPSYSPTTKMIAAMRRQERSKLRSILRGVVPAFSNGEIGYSSRANAVKARAPG